LPATPDLNPLSRGKPGPDRGDRVLVPFVPLLLYAENAAALV